MRRLVTVALATTAVIIMASVAVVSQYEDSKPVAQVSTAETETERPQLPTREELLRLVNKERRKVGVSPLTTDETLNRSAQWKAEDMERRDYFGHEDPDTGRKNGLDYLNKIGNRCLYISENLVDMEIERDTTAYYAITAFKNSEKHYRAMIDAKYDTTGFGIYDTTIVQHFCDLG